MKALNTEPAFGWHFDPHQEHATRQQLIDSFSVPVDTTDEDLFWVRHRVGMDLLNRMPLRPDDRQMLKRSRVFWLWLRRLWLEFDDLMIERMSAVHALHLAKFRERGLSRRIPAFEADVRSKIKLSMYEDDARKWFEAKGFYPSTALLDVVQKAHTPTSQSNPPKGTNQLQ